MDIDETISGEVYVLQGLLAANPQFPRWVTIHKSAIGGWEKFEGSQGRMAGYHLGRFWTDCMAWDNERYHHVYMDQHPHNPPIIMAELNYAGFDISKALALINLVAE